MTMNDASRWADSIVGLVREGHFQSELAQIRAKALLAEMTPQIPPYNWTYVPSRIVRNAIAALFGLEIVVQTESSYPSELMSAARQFAFAWESLAKLEEKTTRESALINAAVAYELAGYQANAACIARQLGRPVAQIDRPNMVEIAATFLQRLFLQVLYLADLARKEPQLDAHLQRSLWEAAAIALAADGFAHASRYFLTGAAEQLERARQVFGEAERTFASLGLVLESNLARSVRSLLPVMRSKSTWNIFQELTASNPRWRRYLKLLARGPGVDVLRSPSVSELWPSQIDALERGLLTSNSSKVIRMPTSAGKTRIAELAIVHVLATQPGAKCVYVAPYRALVWELERSFLNLFGDLGFRVASVLGTYESDDFEQMLIGDADVLVTTPEKLDLLHRVQPEFLNGVRLFILDEGQIVHDRRRGVKFELLFTRLKTRLPNARFLFLSAVVPQEALEDFARWFNAEPEKDILTSSWRPSLQRFAKFEWRGETGVIRYSSSEDIELLQEFVPGVIRQQIYEYTNEDTGRINRRRFPDIKNKSQTAAELAFRFAELGPVLVFCSQTNFAEAVGRALQLRLDLHSLTGGASAQYFETASTRSAIVAREWLGQNHLITSLLQSGIAIHHGDLPEAIRKAVETDFRERRFRILVATNTLAQGVNLPIRTVVVHSCWRGSADGSRERIPSRDYWNIAGRAGRAGEETEGTIIHIVASESDERDFAYYLQKRDNVEPLDSALFQLLKDLVQDRLTEAALSDVLDPEILAMLVEEGLELAALSEEVIDSMLSQTLVSAQAARHRMETQRLGRAIQVTAERIVQHAPDTEHWSVYSSTGLRSASCEKLRQHILDNERSLRRLLSEAGPDQLNELAIFFLEACLAVPEMEPDREFGGSYTELLQRWLSGAAIPDIRAEFGDQVSSLEELAKFIEDLFGYRLPWGISAYLRIAASTLDLDSSAIPDFVKFFPSMVKFGLPDPASCWAMAAGIPFRRMAIEVAAVYLDETNTPNYADFLKWLGQLDSDRLRYDFGLKSPVLEDVSRALSRSSINPLLREFCDARDILPREVEVRGINYEDRAKVALSARVGMPVTLVRDYDNVVDRNAVRVQLGSAVMGYLPRELAQLLAADMDAGLRLAGRIAAVEKGPVPRIRLRVEIMES